MNKVRMLKLAKRIESSPRGFDMSTWIKTEDGDHFDMVDEIPENICGTSCCIAGEAVLLALEEGEITRDQEIDIMEAASKYLGIDDLDNIVYAEDWDEPFQSMYFATGDQEERKAIAGQFLRHIISE